MRGAGLALAGALALAACKGGGEGAPPTDERPPPVPAAEITRGEQACAAYVAQVCACSAPPAAEACKLARALPEALQVAVDIAARSEVSRVDVLQANDSIRKTIRTCIEQTARLPTLGC